ncbi:MAG: phosphoribosyltransferase [Verrucomicrobiota bacterium]
MHFRNRTDAGRYLAQKMGRYGDAGNVVVLALPRGGVPVGYEVAAELRALLGIFLVRKLGVPGHEEFALGAIALGGAWFVNEDIVRQLGISRQQIQSIVERETQEMDRRAEVYGEEFSNVDVQGRTVILVDDGLATGSTMRAAVNVLKQRNPERIVIAVPVASDSACDQLKGEVSEIVCVYMPENFHAVGQCYDDFSQTSDEEVRELLMRAKGRFDPRTASLSPLVF